MLLWFASALAAPCPDVAVQIELAWSAFHDAELAQAEGHLADANTSLTCQQRVVSTEELLELFRLQGLVALARQDPQGSLYATIRTVTIDPTAPPASELGPDIAALHETWTGRLAGTTVVLLREGAGDAWVDGRPVAPDGAGTRVVAGEHLIQARDEAGWHAQIVELADDTRLGVGSGLTLSTIASATPPAVRVVPVGPFNRPHRTELLVVGGAATAAGIGLLVGGGVRHQQFKRDAYLDAVYGDCARADDCYGLAREQAIRGDARVVRVLYGAGYALGALGVATLGVELFLLPAPMSGGGSLGVRGRW